MALTFPSDKREAALWEAALAANRDATTPDTNTPRQTLDIRQPLRGAFNQLLDIFPASPSFWSTLDTALYHRDPYYLPYVRISAQRFGWPGYWRRCPLPHVQPIWEEFVKWRRWENASMPNTWAQTGASLFAATQLPAELPFYLDNAPKELTNAP